MLSKLTDTVKRITKSLEHSVSSYTKQFLCFMRKSLNYLAGRVVAGARLTGRYLKECFRAFGRLVKGFGRWIRQFFLVKKQEGCRVAIRKQCEAFKLARTRHANLFLKGAIVAVPLALMVLVGVTAPVLANFTIAKRVVYAKMVLGDIPDTETYEFAKNYFIDSVAVDDGANFLEEARLKTVYIIKNRVLSAEALAKMMLRNTKSLVSAYGLYVEDQLALVTENSAPLYNQLYSVLEKANNGNETAQSDFVQSIEVRDGFYPTDDCADTAELEEAFEENTLNLSIKTTIMEQYDEAIPYSVEKKNTDKLNLGKTKTVTKGKDGVNHITAQVTYVDGSEIERVITDTQVVSEPVAQQLLIGTKKTAVEASVVSSKTMLWPIPKSTRYRISSQFHDARSDHTHQGLDIACDKGTPIYAAMDGIVTKAENSDKDSYGKHVIIDHGNNLSTLYAHCSVLGVSVGDKVSKGDQIAAVGSTGRSTGNHVHFEVRINGKRYNPLNYLDK